jgi:two-component system sensor histidine kinase MtrB
VVTGTGIALVALLALIAAMMTRLVVTPVRVAARTAQRLSAGLLDQRMEVRGEDDLAKLAAAFNQMAANLQRQILRLEEMSRLQRRFTSDVSHELRTPLTAILGYAYLLRDAGGLAPEQGVQLERIESAGTQLLGLIDDLLDLTRLQLGRLPARVETCDAAALLRAAMASLATPPGLLVRVVAPDASIPVRSDASQVVRILRHLVSNAFKFTRQGSVTVRLRVVAGSPWSEQAQSSGDVPHTVQWEVHDTGIGIAGEDLERVFDEFRQVDGSSTRSVGGAGIGLALSRQMARRLGGDVLLSSEPGKGSRFTLALPAGLATLPAAEAE